MEIVIYFATALQVIIFGIAGWALVTLIAVQKELAAIKAELRSVPLSQIQDNTKRITKLEIDLARLGNG